jgi:hypothetical protein
MATFKSDLAEGQSAKGDNRVDGRLLAGKVRQSNAVITVPAGFTAGDIVEVVTLPTGALINIADSYVVTESLGATLTASLVCEGAGSAFSNSIDLSSAGKVDFDADGGLYTVEAGQEKVNLVVDTSATVVVGATARVVISFIDRN